MDTGSKQTGEQPLLQKQSTEPTLTGNVFCWVCVLGALSSLTYAFGSSSSGERYDCLLETDQFFQTAETAGSLATNILFGISPLLALYMLLAQKEERPNVTKGSLAFLFGACVALPTYFLSVDFKNFFTAKQIFNTLSSLILIPVNAYATLSLLKKISSCRKPDATNAAELYQQLPDQVRQTLAHNYSQEGEVPKSEELIGLAPNKEMSPQTNIKYCLLPFYCLTIGTWGIAMNYGYSMETYFAITALLGNHPTTGKIIGALATAGQAVPSLGFSVEGLESLWRKITFYKSNPTIMEHHYGTLLTGAKILTVMFALFSGGTADAATQRTLERQFNLSFPPSNCSATVDTTQHDTTGSVLCFLTNIGFALIFNLPQALGAVEETVGFLANRYGKKEVKQQIALKDVLAATPNEPTMLAPPRNLGQV
jgi:hypothetical protein